jgi:Spy/CpxP family protein refolding chaperone
MKKQLTILLLLILPVFMYCVADGQTTTPPANGGAPGMKRAEKIDALKAAFITKQLDLTPDEAEKFWPVYNQYQNEIQALNQSRMANTNNAKPDIDNMSDADINKMIENELAYEQQQIDIRKKYVAQFEKVLSVKKVAKLFQAEKDFKLYLLHQMSRDDGSGQHDRFRPNNNGN